MKNKILVVFLIICITATLLTGCGGEKTASSEKEVTENQTEDAAAENSEMQEELLAEAEEPFVEALEVKMAEAEELPAEAFAHITFDGEAEGYKALIQNEEIGENDGASFGLSETEVEFVYASGAVGNALFLDGSYGLDLGLNGTQTDAYTISYWMNADRLSSFGPTLQMGYNIGKTPGADNNVTWLNVTQSEWGEDSAKIFPIVWSRDEASNGDDGTDCWPWMYAFDNEIHGKDEWVMVTIVCSGEEQKGAAGVTTAGAQFYINGAMVYDSQANYLDNTYFEYTWDATLAPNIMKNGDSKFESLFGINYWDTIYKGYVDDLYIYDSALTPGQVASLYQRNENEDKDDEVNN